MDEFQSIKRRMSLCPVGDMRMPRITPSQWGALMAIADGKESTIKDVSMVLGVTSSAATQLVDGLVESGYVIRKEDPKDRRRVTLVLSRTTRDHVTKMKNQVMKKFLETFKVLDDKEFTQYLVLSKKLIEGLSDEN